MTGITEIRHGRVVTPTEVIDDGRVVITGSRIADVSGTGGGALPRSEAVDADGRLVMPGLVDLHGDDVEQHLHPRSGAQVDTSMALSMADRVNVLTGVTTKFHAVAFENSPDDDRTISEATELVHEIANATYLLSDNRVHARCELVEESVRSVEELSEDVDVDLVSVMHHVPGDGQYDRDAFERHYVEDRNWPTERVAEAISERRSLSPTDRRSLSERVADVAAAADAPLASHDDETARDIDRLLDHGASISEYPLTREAARHASDRGMTTVMGAPNVLRGGSLWDNLSARAAIDDGIVDVLCSDYHPPSLLAAPFVDTGEPLPTRTNRVTRNPADAVGMHDRGRIEVGARADLLVVDPDPVPTVERVFVDGVEVLKSGGDPRGRSPERRPRLGNPTAGPSFLH
ncbi:MULTISPECIES: alpha-D-ribose 1-methylphosphonate 5-triphosphate diphosphatase [Haloferacaceae]|uniref:Alpha-D-ribose 1-methylphosphonate 5-triphosphate diphosphatase n=1 Tax=Halorubrum glutamatedens TaxID=2707018 RepID=A0ABD5QS25_9EURY|nr:alpha-D-ribose 1-methylphosphonate 5-triphosphate diphosphatase [Halobellus captivus]